MRQKRTISIQKSIARTTQLKNKSVDLHVKEPTLEETEQMLKEIIDDFPKLFGVPKELMNPIK